MSKKSNLQKAFENIEKHDIKVSTVLMPEKEANRIIQDLKNWKFRDKPTEEVTK